MRCDATPLSEVHGPPAPDLDASLWELFCRVVSAHPDREALVSLWQRPRPAIAPATAPSPGRLKEEARSRNEIECLRWSYVELFMQADRLAEALKNLGHGRGSPILLVLGNSAEWALFFWVAVKVGMKLIAADPRAIGDLQQRLASSSLLSASDVDDDAIVVVPDVGSAAAIEKQLESQHPRGWSPRTRIQCSAEGNTIEGWLQLWEQILLPSSVSSEPIGEQRAASEDRPEPNGSHHDDFALNLMTSGTTGTPKICSHTQRNLIAQTSPFDDSSNPSAIDRWLVHTPICHIFAVNNALRAWRTASVVVLPSQAFDLSSTTEALVAERCTVMSATPALVRRLLGQANPPAHTLDYVTLGGTIIARPDVDMCRNQLGAANAIQAYGLTEGAPLISWSKHDALLKDGYHPGVGRVLPGAKVRICCPGQEGGGRDPLPRGEIGELHVGGPSVVSAYVGGVHAESFYTDTAGHWFITGDQATMDGDGVVYILGRLDDLIIKRGGEKVQPVSIEGALSRQCGIEEIQVVGVDDALAGQVAVAIVQRLPLSLSKAEVARQARSLGPGYVLDAIHTLEELGLEQFPRTATGKVNKRGLGRLVAEFREAATTGHAAAMVAGSIPRSLSPSVSASRSRSWSRARWSGGSPLQNATRTLSLLSGAWSKWREEKEKPKQEEGQQDEEEGLIEMLTDVWERVGGLRPTATDSLHRFADSIMLLRYCDGVRQACGVRVYVQDLVVHDSVAKQATLIGHRRRAQSARPGRRGYRGACSRGGGAYSSGAVCGASPNRDGGGLIRAGCGGPAMTPVTVADPATSIPGAWPSWSEQQQQQQQEEQWQQAEGKEKEKENNQEEQAKEKEERVVAVVEEVQELRKQLLIQREQFQQVQVQVQLLHQLQQKLVGSSFPSPPPSPSIYFTPLSPPPIAKITKTKAPAPAPAPGPHHYCSFSFCSSSTSSSTSPSSKSNKSNCSSPYNTTRHKAMASVATFTDGSDFSLAVEETIPIRSSLMRMVSGQRPQSYNLRIVFVVRGEPAESDANGDAENGHGGLVSPDQTRRGLITALASHPMLRTTLGHSHGSNGTAASCWHTVKTGSESLYERIIEEHDVDSEEEAKHILTQTPAPAAAGTEPTMFKADIISVKGAQHHYLSLTYNHSVVDALTLIPWHHDLDRCISGEDDGEPVKEDKAKTSYKLFSELLVQYDGSQPAQVAVSYHVQRLSGIQRLRKSLWPPQRAPGWMIADDSGSVHAKARAAIRDEVWAQTTDASANGASPSPWSALESEYRFPRRSRVVRLPHLAQLQELGITPAILAQSAVAVFNFVQTRSQHAIFASWEAGRSWPFVPDWMSSQLPPAEGIDGPTLQWALNVFEAVDGETLGAFLRRVALEARETQRHIHAPWDKVVAGLGADEGGVAEEASFRQSFVWDVSIGLGASSAHRDDYAVLEPVGRYDWADCGFVWSANMVDKDQMCFVASWDTAQMNASEVDDYCDSMAGVLRMLDDANNWDKCVEEVFLK